MEREELQSKLETKMRICWNAYMDTLLALPPIQIIGKAAEISAAPFCCDELTENTAAYPELFLEYLLGFDNPLEVLREQWMNEQCVDHSDELEHAMWLLWDRGSAPDELHTMNSMSMK